MSDIAKYIDSNGNFTHTKINGTEEQIEQVIQLFRETDFYKTRTDSQKIILENIIIPQIIKTGMIPQGMLLELVMPSCNTKFSDMKIGSTITFDLPPQFQNKNKGRIGDE